MFLDQFGLTSAHRLSPSDTLIRQSFGATIGSFHVRHPEVTVNVDTHLSAEPDAHTYRHSRGILLAIRLHTEKVE